MAYETLIVDIEDHVATIRLNRPEALNALNTRMMEELAAALAEMDASIRVRAIVLTGSEKAFAAGADVKEMAPKGFVDMFLEDYFAGPAEAIMRCRKPVIAAVAGYCLGGGCELAMMCDFIIAADTAKFGQPEINLGVIPGIGGTQRLTRLVGKSKAMEMCLTGRFMDAAEAERSGLVSRVVPAKDLMRDARETAGEDRREVAAGGARGQGGGEPQLRDDAARGHPVRAAAVPRALRHRGPGRGDGGLRREAEPAVSREIAAGTVSGSLNCALGAATPCVSVGRLALR